MNNFNIWQEYSGEKLPLRIWNHPSTLTWVCGPHSHYRYPLLFKSLLYTTPHYYLFPLTKRNLRKIFFLFFCLFFVFLSPLAFSGPLMRKIFLKVKIAFRICFAANVKETAHTPSIESSPNGPLPRESHAASQHQATRSLNCIQASARFILCIYYQDVS